jgi:hypothetical protein
MNHIPMDEEHSRIGYDTSGFVKHMIQPHPDTLRDWFAGMALQNCGNYDALWRSRYTKEGEEHAAATASALASMAYEIADAMMQARGEKP